MTPTPSLQMPTLVIVMSLTAKKISRPIRRAASQVKPTEAVIYEMSVRDFSMQKEAGFSQPGKFASLSESPSVHGHTLV